MPGIHTVKADSTVIVQLNGEGDPEASRNDWGAIVPSVSDIEFTDSEPLKLTAKAEGGLHPDVIVGAIVGVALVAIVIIRFVLPRTRARGAVGTSQVA
jgi:hypothetical protein